MRHLLLSILSLVAFAQSSHADDQQMLFDRGSAVLAKLPPIFLYDILYNPRRDEIVAQPRCVLLTRGTAATLKSYVTFKYLAGVIPVPFIQARLAGLTDIESGAETIHAFELMFRPLPFASWGGEIWRDTPSGPLGLPIDVRSCLPRDRTFFGVLTSGGVVALGRWTGHRERLTSN